MKWKDSLRIWREDRGLTEPQVSINKETGNPAIIDMLLEEVEELRLALLNNDEHEIIDACNDLIVLSSNHVAQSGYDLDLTMKETLKEINSRTGSINEVTGKWEKFKTQEAKAKWYKANYKTCRIKHD